MQILKTMGILLVLIACKYAVAETAVIQKSDVIFTKVATNVYVTTNNQGANVAMLVSNEGILLIDSGTRRKGAAQALLKGIRKVSDKTIKYVINTHYHFDHSGGNYLFAELGAIIIGQQYNKYSPSLHHLSFKSELSLNFGGEQINVYHTPGHTLDSAIVQLVNNNIFLMGDTFSTEMITYEGASGKKGYDNVMNLVLSLSNDKSILVPGHGEFSHRDDMIKGHKVRDKYRQRLGKLYRQGWSMEKIFADNETKDIVINYPQLWQRLVPDMIEANYVQYLPLTDSLLDQYVGEYIGSDEQITQVVKIGNKLQIRRQGSFVIELRSLSDGRFDLVGFPFVQDEQVIFSSNKSGKIDKLLLQIPNRFVLNNWIVAGESLKIIQ